MITSPALVSLTILALVFLPLLVAPADGLFWDIGGLLGFLALVGLVLQTLPCRKAGEQLRHARSATWVIALAFAHALRFLAGDPILRFSLRPMGPVHLWCAAVALALLAGMTVQARPPDRLRVHAGHRDLSVGHRAAACLTLGLAALQVGLSGFYASGVGLLAMALVPLAIARVVWLPRATLPTPSVSAYLAGGVVIGLLVVVTRWA